MLIIKNQSINQNYLIKVSWAKISLDDINILNSSGAHNYSI